VFSFSLAVGDEEILGEDGFTVPDPKGVEFASSLLKTVSLAIQTLGLYQVYNY